LGIFLFFLRKKELETRIMGGLKVEMVVVVKDQEGVDLMSLSYQVASFVLILGRVSCDGATMATSFTKKDKEGKKEKVV
jgi:hypothetical protein